MTNAQSNELKRITLRIENEAKMTAYEEIERKVVERAETIERLLYSHEAITIRGNIYGAKFDKLQAIRNRLWGKARTYYEVASICHEHWRKATQQNTR